MCNIGENMDIKEKITTNLNRHPWEIARKKFVLKELAKYNSKGTTVADIGAGDMYITNSLINMFEKTIAIDKRFESSGSNLENIVAFKSISELVDESIDFITLLDVLEHIENDYEFLVLVNNKLSVNGKLILTVPCYSFLFSSHDIYLEHFRRYDMRELISLLRKTHFKIIKKHYFFGLLVLPRILIFLFEKLPMKFTKQDYGIGNWKYGENSFITKFISTILHYDSVFQSSISDFGVNLFGLSIFLVCEKEIED